MTVNAITDTKKGRTGIAPTYLHTTPGFSYFSYIISQNTEITDIKLSSAK